MTVEGTPARWAVDGRDAEIAVALPGLAGHGDAAKRPTSIMVKY